MFARKPLLDVSHRTARRHKNLFDASDLQRPFMLRSSVGFGPRANRRKDTSLVEAALERSGYLPAGRRPTGHMSRSLDTAVRQFQHDNQLNDDGLITPGGPTLQRLARTFDQEVVEPPHNLAKPRTIIPTVEAEAFSENARTVQHLSGNGEDGLFPTLLSDAFRSGKSGQAEVVDFFVQLRQRDPDRARVLREKTEPSLGTAQGSLLDDLIDDVATERAEDADILTRKDTEKEGKKPDPAPDEGEGGEDEKPPAEPEQPDPEENDLPEDPENEQNCSPIAADIENMKQTKAGINKEMNRTGFMIHKTETRIAELRANLGMQSARAGQSGIGAMSAIRSGAVLGILGSALSAGKLGSDIYANYLELVDKGQLLEGYQDQLADYQSRFDDLTERISEAEKRLQECLGGAP